VFDRFEQATFLQSFIIRLPKNLGSKKRIVLMACGAHSFSDCAYDLAEVAG
jgi:hypothetical protein